jgi:hypothetical protein
LSKEAWPDNTSLSTIRRKKESRVTILFIIRFHTKSNKSFTPGILAQINPSA